jgi:hypothetical protein
MNQSSKSHPKTWSQKIASLDAYIFVTPEYNHATSAALKNAIDFLFHEWNNKAAGFVGYGGAPDPPPVGIPLRLNPTAFAKISIKARPACERSGPRKEPRPAASRVVFLPRSSVSTLVRQASYTIAT